MLAKILAATSALFATSATLANAPSVAYTFNLGSDVPAGVTKNLSVRGVDEFSETGTMESAFGSGAKFSISRNAGKLNAVALDTTTLGSDAIGLLATAGIASSDVSKITTGVQDGQACCMVSFGISGLEAGTEYTLTFLIEPTASETDGTTKSSYINWDSGYLISGKYAGASGSTTLKSGNASIILTETAVVQLNIKMKSGGYFYFGVSNGHGATAGKSSLGFLSIAKTASIPEPSAFSLLAGLGTIAFAVSRRRRER